MRVAEVSLQRTELSSLYDALQWADDGSIAVNTSTQLTLLKPKFIADDVKITSKTITTHLFEVEKIDLESLPRNNLYLNEVPDEVVSTLFTTTDVSVTKCKWSPLSSLNECFLAVLTNCGSFFIFKNGKLWKDLTSTVIAETQVEVDQNIIVSFDWIKSSTGNLSIVTGLASGDTKIFQYNEIESGFKELGLTKVSQNSIVSLKSFKSSYIAISSKNELYLVTNSVTQLKEADRFKIHDVFFYENKNQILFATSTKIFKISIQNQSITFLDIGVITTSKLLQTGSNELSIVTESKTLKIDLDSFKQIFDDSIDPILQKCLNKWNACFNDFNTKIFTLKRFGADLNYNGSIMSVLYMIQNVNGFRYKISSENTFKILFIPLNANSFNNQPSSLAIFQNYKLTGNFQDFKQLGNTGDLDLSLSLDEFLNSILFKNLILRNASINNLIKGGQDETIRKYFAESIIKYVETNNIPLDNDIDKVVYNNYLRIAGKPQLANLPEKVLLKTDSFDQTFNFGENNEIETIKSTDGLTWTRCSLTSLPILSPKVLADPVTEKRIIDIKRDVYNDYGELSNAVLNLNIVSLYSGSTYIEKE